METIEPKQPRCLVCGKPANGLVVNTEGVPRMLEVGYVECQEAKPNFAGSGFTCIRSEV